VVVVRDEQVLGPGREGHCERFLGRVFRVEGVRSVAIDRSRATAAIRHEAGAGPHALAGFLGRLAAALREHAPEGPHATLPRGVREVTCTVFRHGALLSTCEVLSDRPGRLRLRHGELSRDHALARHVEELLTRVPGVRRATFGAWTESLLVRYDAAAL